MSFIDKISGIARSAVGFLRGKSIGSTLARTALIGLALNKLNKSFKDANTPKIQDKGVELSVNPDTEYSVPVLYGDAYITGKVTDAFLETGNRNMWFCITLCEKTGNLIDGTASEISFKELYYDNFRISFKQDGYTVETIYDDSNNSSNKWDGLIKIYPFNGGSESPTQFTYETTGNTQYAYNLMPNWSSTDTMDDLVFCLVKITYSKAQDLTRLGNLQFRLSNTLKEPGDVLYDYMINTRYGAGIPEEEINV